VYTFVLFLNPFIPGEIMGQIIKRSVTVLLIWLFAIGVVSGNQMDSGIQFHPINHATLVIQSKTVTIFVDPVGNRNLFDSYPKPDLILITHAHKDHLSKALVDAVKKPTTLIIATQEVVSMLNEGKVLHNGESYTHDNIVIDAIPAYNLTDDRQVFHPKGRDNGYVITLSGNRIYLSGDTEDIPAMRGLKNIDTAFVCMNLPYTMTEDQAASAVLAFRPKVVIPYHYRGANGMSDIKKFKEMVEKDGNIQVKLLSWY